MLFSGIGRGFKEKTYFVLNMSVVNACKTFRWNCPLVI